MKTKPRFLLTYDFLDSKDFGGIEQLIATHAKMLIDSGFNAKLLFCNLDTKAKENNVYKELDLEEYGSKKIKCEPLRLIAGIIGANNLKQIIQPNDIIISYSFPINVTIRNFTNKKIVYLNHYPNFLYLPIKERYAWANNITRKIAFLYSLILGRITKKIDKKYISKASLLFTNSNFTKNKLLPIYDKDIIVSYPPINSIFKNTIDKGTLEKYNIQDKYLFASGRLIKDKHMNLLLEAYAKTNQTIQLVIAGRGTELESLKILSSKLNIYDNIKFIGFVPTNDLIKLYSMAEAYLMPTMKEDYGMCTAEALSCGTPIIVWNDGGGSCEQCIDGINGYKATSYDILDFARCIDKCVKDDFKSKHSEDILNSSKKFSDEHQKDIFINNIRRIL